MFPAQAEALRAEIKDGWLKVFSQTPTEKSGWFSIVSVSFVSTAFGLKFYIFTSRPTMKFGDTGA